MTVKVIAEIGINHNGNIQTAMTMAEIAKACGADFVKLQKREIDWCYSEEQLNQPCDSQWGNTVRDKVVGRELSWNDIDKFQDYCKKIGIGWTASCFDLYSLRLLNENYYHIAFNKVPSCMHKRPQFLKAVAQYQELTLISTGLCQDTTEIIDIATIFEKACCPYVINHCVALYPAPLERLHLNYIDRLIQLFASGRYRYWRGIGYSGHEVSLTPSVIAAHCGATWIERHFTLDRSARGSDHAASVEPQGLKRMIRDIRMLPIIEGDVPRHLYGDEKDPVTFWREE